MISAVIITRNEERNIGRCLQSLDGVVDEIIVVDSGSTDRTEEICTTFFDRRQTVSSGRFEYHPWEGYAEQKNHANRLATHTWILSIDADEALSPELRDSIIALKRDLVDTHPSTVFNVNRLTNYCSHWIRHCGWYPDRCTRLFHRETAQWGGLIHEQLSFSSTPVTINLKGDLLHYSYYSVGEHADRTVKYSLMAAQKAFDQGKRARCGDTVFKPVWTFFRNYFLRLGFLDGTAGFTVCRLSATYTFLKYAKLKEIQQCTSSLT